MVEARRVVITGMGALTPIGGTLDTYWQGLCEGRSGAGPITRFDASAFKTRFACELKGFDAHDHIERREARKMDPYIHYGLVAGREALADAGLRGPDGQVAGADPDRFGVIWGSGNGGISSFEQEVEGYVDGGRVPRFSPFLIPRMLVDMGAGWLSMDLGLRGLCYTTVSACATANTALIAACHHIRYGQADLVLAGGSEAAITASGIGGFAACRALSTNNAEAMTASRPLDGSRDGFVMGEGAGALVVEELGHALARGARIYAELSGGGMSGDAYHLTATHPEGEGALRGMRAALADAGLEAKDLDHINLHATSTPTGDLSEMRAVASLLGQERLGAVALNAVKSMTGHLLGASSAIEAIATVLALYHQQVPPMINLTALDAALPEGIAPVVGAPRAMPLRHAMSNAFGFGGKNASVIFSQYQAN